MSIVYYVTILQLFGMSLRESQLNLCAISTNDVRFAQSRFFSNAEKNVMILIPIDQFRQQSV